MDKSSKDLGYDVIEQFYPPEELKEEIKNVDIVIVRSATKIRKDIIDAATETNRLKLVIRGGVGVDNIDVSYAEEKGIQVKNTPLASSISVAELTIGHMFSLARYLYISNVTMREGKWNKKQYEGSELYGKTLGLIGFGRISVEVAKRAHALGMKVIYTNRSGEKSGYPDFTYTSFDNLISSADYISIHTPATKDNNPLLGEAEFNNMKDGVFIVDCARGGIIDEEALIVALDSGKVAGAALDVFEKEPTTNERLYKHEKVSLSPHIGGSTKEAQGRIGEEIVSIVKNYKN
jgi:D-3-phosphoglycerate dehydrogenase